MKTRRKWLFESRTVSEGEGTIPTFSHWEKVAEGRMRAAAPSGPACRAS